MKFSLEKLLKIKETKVTNCEEIERLGLIIEIEPTLGEAVCPRCGQVSTSLHQNHRYYVRDLPISSTEVLLRVNRRQFKCSDCKKPFSEELMPLRCKDCVHHCFSVKLSFSILSYRRPELIYVEKGKTYTKRLAVEIVKQVTSSNIASVARKNDLTEEEVESMVSLVAQKDLEIDLSNLKRLGIDEIALRKGHKNFLTILVDLDTRKPVAMVPSRRQEELEKILLSWLQSVLNQIEEVCIDFGKGYKSLILKIIPNAMITGDRFHLMQMVNRELDDARKAEKARVKKMKKSDKKQVLEGALNSSKYSLLKNECDLNEKQKQKLKEVQKVSPKLAKIHGQKEELRKMLETTNNWVEGAHNLLSWMVRNKEFFIKSVGTMVRWFGEIIGYFEKGTTNGVVEGINNKLKKMKRDGYGFRNFENFQRRVFLNWYFDC